jgi:hypothetical protein
MLHYFRHVSCYLDLMEDFLPKYYIHGGDVHKIHVLLTIIVSNY